MRILIKAQPLTYELIKGQVVKHISWYWNFLHYDIWTNQGHDVYFLTSPERYSEIADSKYKCTSDYKDADIVFFRGFNSFRPDPKWSEEIICNTKAKTIMYLECTCNDNIIGMFDNLYVAECEQYKEFYTKKYPTLNVEVMPWTSVDFNLIDNDLENPYTNDIPKIVYSGIVINRYLDSLTYLAEKGEKIILGGTYYDGEKPCRDFTDKERNRLHPNIQLMNDNCAFELGEQFKFMLHGHIGVTFHPFEKKDGALRAKLIEYLCCGMRNVVESTCPNDYSIHRLNAGSCFNYNDNQSLYDQIQINKELWSLEERNRIKKEARELFNPYKICERIIK